MPGGRIASAMELDVGMFFEELQLASNVQNEVQLLSLDFFGECLD